VSFESFQDVVLQVHQLVANAQSLSFIVSFCLPRPPQHKQGNMDFTNQ
jgi:hypothetical protein